MPSSEGFLAASKGGVEGVEDLEVVGVEEGNHPRSKELSLFACMSLTIASPDPTQEETSTRSWASRKVQTKKK